MINSNQAKAGHTLLKVLFDASSLIKICPLKGPFHWFPDVDTVVLFRINKLTNPRPFANCTEKASQSDNLENLLTFHWRKV